MALRGINRAVHRDRGYFCVGLTVIYAVSGFLLNHIHDFNSNYRVETVTTSLDPSLVGSALTPDGAVEILRFLGVESPVPDTFQPDPGSIQIFVDGSVVEVSLEKGTAVHERVSERWVLKTANDLHPDRAGRLWTWMAGPYTFVLTMLAVTGMFVLQGKRGSQDAGPGWFQWESSLPWP